MKRYFPVLVILLLASNLAFAHGGGLDRNGGHFNRKAGEYHCHREPCLSNQKQVQEATEEAERSSFSSLYHRDDWEHWIDEDNDCMDTRAEILIRDSAAPVAFYSNQQCEVAAGRWPLPYTGGVTHDPGTIDIDHIVPLKWAHGHGGDRWSLARKREFANDPDNLLAVHASANRSKGSKGPDDWMPLIDRCGYAKRWEKVLAKYDLIVVPQERQALQAACK